jgi:hypothetical protein
MSPPSSVPVPPKGRFIINPYDATTQKMAFFIVTTVKTSHYQPVKWTMTPGMSLLFAQQ